MKELSSPVGQWRERLRQQRLNNARIWLEQLQNTDSPTDLAVQEYGNLLRAIETAFTEPEAFELAFELIEALYPYAFNFADWERWLHYLEEALRQSQQLERDDAEARLYDQIGDLLLYTDRMAEAEVAYRKSLTHYQALDDASRQTYLLVKLATLYNKQGRLGETRALRRQIEALLPQCSNPDLRPLIHLGLSQLFNFEENWERAVVEGETAANAFRQEGKTIHEVRALNNIAMALSHAGDWPQAEEVITQLMAMLTAVEDYLTLSSAMINLGLTAFHQRAYHQAEQYWQEALQLQSQVKGKEHRAILLNNLGMVYTKLSEWHEADKMFAEAADYYRQMGDLLSWANVMDNVADLRQAQGDYNGCVGALEEIMAAFQDTQNNEPFETVYRNAVGRLGELAAMQ